MNNPAVVNASLDPSGAAPLSGACKRAAELLVFPAWCCQASRDVAVQCGARHALSSAVSCARAKFSACVSSGGPGGTAWRGEGLLAEAALRAGRFGFVELRTDELATSATALDKVELCGRHINVGRPKVLAAAVPSELPVSLHPGAPKFAIWLLVPRASGASACFRLLGRGGAGHMPCPCVCLTSSC